MAHCTIFMLISSVTEMDKVIRQISSGVGQKRSRRGNTSVLVRLGSSRRSDDFLGSETSDDDYEPYKKFVVDIGIQS